MSPYGRREMLTESASSSHKSLRVANRSTMPATITSAAAAMAHRVGEVSSSGPAPSGGMVARAGASEATFIARTVTAATGSGGFVSFLEVPPLDLDHHRQQVPNVEARDREHAVVGDLAIDDVDPVVTSVERLGPAEHVVELLLGLDRETEVVEPRARHGRIVGDEEHELLVGVRRQDQLLAFDGLGGQLLPAEDLVVEAHEVAPAVLAEQLRRDAHGHVVEPRRTGRGRHPSPPFPLRGAIITLAGSSPETSCSTASYRPSSGTSSDSMGTSDGKSGDARSSSARGNPSGS